MAKKHTVASVVEELAEFLASQPTRTELLNYHPSAYAVRRAEELLQQQNEGRIARDEQLELEELAHAERLMRLIKARLRRKRVS